ncbi:MAG: hypothetical protein V1921_01000 [Candidatus Altiarchaeota archaeon]
MAKKLKSKKFMVYIYQSEKGGGNICECDEKGGIISTNEHPFNDKDEALQNFRKILDKYCKF